MDKKTLDYYKNNANEIFQRYEDATEGMGQFFRKAFPPKSKVLDIGAGSCRDMKKLIPQGYEVIGVEPCQELIDLALKHHPELPGKLFQGSLPDLDEKYNEKFDGVLCSAILMHIPKEQLFDTAFSLKRVLKPGGYLLISVPRAGPKTNDQFRDKKDKLPTRNLLTKRKDALIHYWRLNNSFNQKRFLYEINNLNRENH